MKRIWLWTQLIAMYMGAYISAAPFWDKNWERPMKRIVRKIMELDGY